MHEHCGVLRIEWDNGWINWARVAAHNTFKIVGTVDTQPFDRFEASSEGAEVWRIQRQKERDPKLRTKALSENAKGHAGRFTCEGCEFAHSDDAMLDVHHMSPICGGQRNTQVSDLIVFCPTCHRRAHRSGNKLRPYSLDEIRAWVRGGRQ